MKVCQRFAFPIAYVFVDGIIPSSWGSSWHKTARAVAKPATLSPLNAAPIARPSVRLCMPSPMITIHVTEPKVSLHWYTLSWLCWWFMGTRSVSSVTTICESEKKNGLHCSISHIITMMFVWVKIYQIRSFRDGEYASYGIWHTVVPLTGTGSVEDITSWMFQNYML